MLLRVVAFCCLFQVSLSGATSLTIYTEHAPPFQVQTEQSVSGSATDIVRAIVAEAGHQAEIQVLPWTRAISSAMQRSDVMVYSLIKSESRADKMYWIAPVLFYELAFIGRDNRADISINAYEDVKRYSTALVRGDATLPYLESYGFDAEKHFVLVHSIEEAWRLMLIGKVDLIIDDVKAIKPMLRHYGNPSHKVSTYFAVKGLSVPAYLAASKSFDPTVVASLQQAFERIRAKGQYPLEQTYTQWLSSGIH